MRIAFYKGGQSLADQIIMWKTEGPYSHCEAVLGFNPVSQAYTCASSSLRDGGVRFKDIRLDPSKWDVIDVPGVDAAKVARFFLAHDGEPYDTRGVISFVVPVGNTPDGWFCSEALGAAAGIREAKRFDPTSLACVFECMGGLWIQGGPAWAKAA